MQENEASSIAQTTNATNYALSRKKTYLAIKIQNCYIIEHSESLSRFSERKQEVELAHFLIIQLRS